MDEPSDYELARFILLRPRMLFSEARSLRDVLALLHGAAVGRYPWHGSGFLPGFFEFVGRRFRQPARNQYSLLLDQFGHLPGLEGCAAVLSLLEEWKAVEDQSGGQAATA